MGSFETKMLGQCSAWTPLSPLNVSLAGFLEGTWRLIFASEDGGKLFGNVVDGWRLSDLEIETLPFCKDVTRSSPFFWGWRQMLKARLMVEGWVMCDGWCHGLRPADQSDFCLFAWMCFEMRGQGVPDPSPVSRSLFGTQDAGGSGL